MRRRSRITAILFGKWYPPRFVLFVILVGGSCSVLLMMKWMLGIGGHFGGGVRTNSGTADENAMKAVVEYVSGDGEFIGGEEDNMKTMRASMEGQKLHSFQKSRENDITLSLSRAEVDLKRRCFEAVSRLVHLNINFLAFDFDLTIVDIHTGGRWKKSAVELAARVRPLMKTIIGTALHNDLHVAVVTFSQQEELIADVLRHCLPAFATGSKIPIQGGGQENHSKNKHILAAKHRIERINPDGASISRSSTLLIDDDPNNIRKALALGTRAILLDPNEPLHLLRDILALA